jgi:tRNA A-37 threonylcarbamoyl transferase component Bud32
MYRPDGRRRSSRNQCAAGPIFKRLASDAIAQAARGADAGSPKDLLRSASDLLFSDDLRVTLEKLLGAPQRDGEPSARRLRNQDYRIVEDYLRAAGKQSWAERPRTFTVLWMIGEVGAMEAFIAQGLKDLALPYSDSNLPDVFSGKQARSNFLKYQNNVLDKRAADVAMELEAGGQHLNLDGTAEDYFRRIKRLGEGGFSHVDEVIGHLSGQHFALKRMLRHTIVNTDRSRLQALNNELQTLKRLDHQHIIRLVGSFTDRESTCLLMSPVAHKNLAQYMWAKVDGDAATDRKYLLRNFFGCIAAAVHYLHSHNVRHKDIKPENILVKDTTVYITDFGTSSIWVNDASSTTEGTVKAFTRAYSAPEVLYGKVRLYAAKID